jgi:hypothetical protein
MALPMLPVPPATRTVAILLVVGFETWTTLKYKVETEGRCNCREFDLKNIHRGLLQDHDLFMNNHDEFSHLVSFFDLLLTTLKSGVG